jgi:hypothetical protein
MSQVVIVINTFRKNGCFSNGLQEHLLPENIAPNSSLRKRDKEIS